MQHGSPAPSFVPVIRVVSTPVPPGRLSRDLAVQLRAMYDDLLSEPVPDRLLAMVAPCPDGITGSLQEGDERWSSYNREWR